MKTKTAAAQRIPSRAGDERVAKWFSRIGRKHNPSLPEEEHSRREHVLRTDKKFLEVRMDELTAGMEDAIGKSSTGSSA